MKLAWRVTVLLLALTGGAALANQKAASAERVLADATAQAAAEHKNIFLTFQASWCGPCHELEKFVHEPKVRAILEKYFTFANVNVAEEGGKHPELESPGGEELLKKMGGMGGGASSLPYIVMLDEQAEPIINSNRPVHGKQKSENIGYPAAPQEIYWFMAMLKKSAPAMTEEESRALEERLRKLAGN